MKHIIYKHTSPSGKFYIGYTRQNMIKRWKDHCRSARRYNAKSRFYNALRYYNDDSDWKHEIIEEFEGTRADAIIRERYWIQKLNPEYNANKGGSGGWVVKDKETWRKNLSKSISGSGNPKYSGLTDEDIVNAMVERSKHHGRIISINQCREETGLKIPKHFAKCRFEGLGSKGLYAKVESITGLEYDPYYKNGKRNKDENQKNQAG